MTVGAAAAQSATPTPRQDFEVTNSFGLKGLLAFSANIEQRERIYLLDLEQRRVIRAIDGPGNNTYPRFSPDGRQLVFSSDRDGQRDIYIADWDGSNPRRLTNDPASEDNPTWSHDGTQIVYYLSDKDDVANLFSKAASGQGSAQQITHVSGRNVTPDISPDGTRIAFSTNRFWPGWDICLWNTKSAGETCPLGGAKAYCRPQWSHDGKFLAFSIGSGDAVDIGTLEVATGVRRNVTDLARAEYDATWSSDDKYLLFASDVGDEIFNLRIVDLDSSRVEPLLSSPFSLRYLSYNPHNVFELETARLKAESPNAGTTPDHPAITTAKSQGTEAVPPVATTLNIANPGSANMAETGVSPTPAK